MRAILPLAAGLALLALPASAEALRCTFDKVCAPEGCKATTYAFRVTWQGEDGEFKDDAGRRADVTVAEMEAFLHFIEVADRGDLVVTSVAEGGVAVHSKHALLGGKLTPTQYYGQCRKAG